MAFRPRKSQHDAESIAVSPYCELWKCEGCDNLHLVLGDISIKLGWEHIVGIANTLNLALYESAATTASVKDHHLSERVVN
ncbi:MAG TPA: hypothetical protein DD440_07835 [Porticoccaceae bacterium]|nr:hypothetical protein [Porticoccaceae bacterium]